MIKECPSCFNKVVDKDFLGKECCYSCQYRIKKELLKIDSKLIGKRKIQCKNCGKEQMGTRWVYCSRECALESKKKMDKGYWTKAVKSEGGSW